MDASAVLEWLLDTSKGNKIARRLSASDGLIHAPHVVDLEIAQALRRLLRSKDLYPSRAEEALQDFLDARILRYPVTHHLPDIWRLRDNLSAYDASYVALAEALDAPLLTCDGRIASAPGHTARIELF